MTIQISALCGMSCNDERRTFSMNRYSFIIPAFNCKDYLPGCIESIIDIGITNYEILIIDDGSTDGSGFLCDEMANINKNIRCYHQNNKGVSASRNKGLELATGNYVLFIDADDQIEPSKLKEVLEVLNDTSDIDMVIFGLSFDYFFRNRMYRRDQIAHSKEGVFDKEELQKDFMSLYEHNLISPVWNKIIRRELLINCNIRFDSTLIEMEDYLFVLQCLARCNQVYISSHVIYRYRQSEDERNTFRRLLKIGNLSKYMSAFDRTVHELESENLVSSSLAVKLKDIIGQIYTGFIQEVVRFGSVSTIRTIMNDMIEGDYGKYVKALAPNTYRLAEEKKYILLWVSGMKVRVRHWIAIRVKYLISLGVGK